MARHIVPDVDLYALRYVLCYVICHLVYYVLCYVLYVENSVEIARNILQHDAKIAQNDTLDLQNEVLKAPAVPSEASEAT